MPENDLCLPKFSGKILYEILYPMSTTCTANPFRFSILPVGSTSGRRNMHLKEFFPSCMLTKPQFKKREVDIFLITNLVLLFACLGTALPYSDCICLLSCQGITCNLRKLF